MSRYLASPRFANALKALLLLALALFLYTRLAGGTLFFYINQRFMVYTVLAIVGLVAVAISYRATTGNVDGEAHSHHAVTWGGLALVLLPVVLGVFVPPQPFGVVNEQGMGFSQVGRFSGQVGLSVCPCTLVGRFLAYEAKPGEYPPGIGVGHKNRNSVAIE